MAKIKKTGKGIFRLPENSPRVFLVDPENSPRVFLVEPEKKTKKAPADKLPATKTD